ncbi:transcriptional regulator EpsA [Chitinimonas arctica]|uniref:Transcriptional regulator EpsA n=1 Tax=Chitinimonas arctica TaxID=2594795 RepID=A0A516SES2_9NEIS|nr:XrtB/PEP-CTERM-associated transcriptional regulator EpsA [Chitinimonas arctica]QDQ26664.1 transcriptional regulator EpsA [Chitinimonas arctica]
MNFLYSLSSEDLGRYSKLIQEVIRVRRHFDLLQWLQGDIQRYLPHEILVAAWGDFHNGVIDHDIVSALPGVRTTHSSSEALAPLLLGLFDRWNQLGKVPYALGVNETGFILENADLQCELGSALQGMRSSLVHGISDERGRHDCLYVIFSSNGELDNSARSTMEVLLPYIDTALRRVEHLPRQIRSTQQTQVNQADEEFGLSSREAEIMIWVRQGKTNPEIASILDISTFTVKNHMQRIFKKLDVFNRTQAVAKLENKILNVGS